MTGFSRDWIGIEAIWSQRPRQFFVTNLDNQGEPEIALDVSWLAQMNGAFLENFVKPNIRWFGYVVWAITIVIPRPFFLRMTDRAAPRPVPAIRL